MASIDMKDAYYSIPVKSEDRMYLRFKWEDLFYESLVFLWVVVCPRQFPKILKPPLATLHKQRHISMHTWMSFIYKVGLMTIVSKML